MAVLRLLWTCRRSASHALIRVTRTASDPVRGLQRLIAGEFAAEPIGQAGNRCVGQAEQKRQLRIRRSVEFAPSHLQQRGLPFRGAFDLDLAQQIAVQPGVVDDFATLRGTCRDDRTANSEGTGSVLVVKFCSVTLLP